MTNHCRDGSLSVTESSIFFTIGANDILVAAYFVLINYSVVVAGFS